MLCERCADEGWIETCRPDGSDCRAEACTCEAGYDWSERATWAAQDAAERERDRPIPGYRVPLRPWGAR